MVKSSLPKEILMKLLALDLGDQWVGVAITDASCILARPLTTTTLAELTSFLTDLFAHEAIEKVIVGYPKTLRGTESEQTKKIVLMKEQLAQDFPEKTWLLWDERLTSKHAQSLGKKGEKLEIHAKAAALILENYLAHMRFQQELENSTNNGQF